MRARWGQREGKGKMRARWCQGEVKVRASAMWAQGDVRVRATAHTYTTFKLLYTCSALAEHIHTQHICTCTTLMYTYCKYVCVRWFMLLAKQSPIRHPCATWYSSLHPSRFWEPWMWTPVYCHRWFPKGANQTRKNILKATAATVILKQDYTYLNVIIPAAHITQILQTPRLPFTRPASSDIATSWNDCCRISPTSLFFPE